MVTEIKRVSVGKDAILRLERYIKALEKRVSRSIRGILVFTKIQRKA